MQVFKKHLDLAPGNVVQWFRGYNGSAALLGGSVVLQVSSDRGNSGVLQQDCFPLLRTTARRGGRAEVPSGNSPGQLSRSAPEEHICPCPVSATAYSALTHPHSGRRSQRGGAVWGRGGGVITIFIAGKHCSRRCRESKEQTGAPVCSPLGMQFAQGSCGCPIPRSGHPQLEAFKARLVGRDLEQPGLLAGILVHGRGWNEVVFNASCHTKTLRAYHSGTPSQCDSGIPGCRRIPSAPPL